LRGTDPSDRVCHLRRPGVSPGPVLRLTSGVRARPGIRFRSRNPCLITPKNCDGQDSSLRMRRRRRSFLLGTAGVVVLDQGIIRDGRFVSLVAGEPFSPGRSRREGRPGGCCGCSHSLRTTFRAAPNAARHATTDLLDAFGRPCPPTQIRCVTWGSASNSARSSNDNPQKSEGGPNQRATLTDPTHQSIGSGSTHPRIGLRALLAQDRRVHGAHHRAGLPRTLTAQLSTDQTSQTARPDPRSIRDNHAHRDACPIMIGHVDRRI